MMSRRYQTGSGHNTIRFNIWNLTDQRDYPQVTRRIEDWIAVGLPVTEVPMANAESVGEAAEHGGLNAAESNTAQPLDGMVQGAVWLNGPNRATL